MRDLPKNLFKEMANFLEKGLDHKDFLTQEGIRQVQEKVEPFFKAIEDELKKEGIKFEERDFTKGIAKKSRQYFYVCEVWEGERVVVFLGLNVEGESDLARTARKSLWWGYRYWGGKKEMEKERKKLEKIGLKGEILKLKDFRGGSCLIYIKGSRSPAELRKEKDPVSLINIIANDIISLYQKIRRGKQAGTERENHLKLILNALNTKPFIILSGISGTGKTQIARIISAGIVKEKGLE